MFDFVIPFNFFSRGNSQTDDEGGTKKVSCEVLDVSSAEGSDIVIIHIYNSIIFGDTIMAWAKKGSKQRVMLVTKRPVFNQLIMLMIRQQYRILKRRWLSPHLVNWRRKGMPFDQGSFFGFYLVFEKSEFKRFSWSVALYWELHFEIPTFYRWRRPSRNCWTLDGRGLHANRAFAVAMR